MFDGAMKKVDDLADFLHDIGTIQELCFEDSDFLLLPDLSNYRSIGDTSLEYMMGIDFDYYKELLPKDIRVQYEKQKAQISLLDDISNMLEFISHRISHRGLHKSFWHKDKPITETETQILLDSLFATYLKDKGMDISREADLGTGKIDFKFFKNHREKVLIEVKLGGNLALVERGIDKQLPHYMDAAGYNNAFYLVICHSSEDVVKVSGFFQGYKSRKKIIPVIFDASKKIVASKL